MPRNPELKIGDRIAPYAERSKQPPLKPSRDSFLWPARASNPQRQAFAVAVYELMTAAHKTPKELSVEFFGGVQGVKGPRPSRAAEVREWLYGELVPQETTAANLARYFDVPMERLLKMPHAAFNADTIRALFRPRTPRVPGAPKNGHAHAAMVSAGTGLGIMLPPGAKPPEITVTTHPEDHDFAVIKIDATLTWEQAQTVINLLRPMRKA